jgi:hypothetical protein
MMMLTFIRLQLTALIACQLPCTCLPAAWTVSFAFPKLGCRGALKCQQTYMGALRMRCCVLAEEKL